MLHAF
jgi:hypothetical protein